jgi:DNA (cytosine-5)-methyltransferase 1
MINVGSDFSGVGAFNQALDSLNIVYKTVFACDWDKYARQTYIHNYGEPDYYPSDVYDRKIPKESLDIYMTSPPCQAFSLAGKRKGEKDKRGILFYNSHEFIVKNKPRYFIFENVKGLLSDDSGKTFNRWLDYLGGKSVNGNPVIFPLGDATPYHIYHKVLNAKNYGVPQNRERVFIVGIRDDSDNNFNWPKPFPLVKRLKDVLETDVDEKYYLSDKMINYLHHRNENTIYGKGKLKLRDGNDTASCITKSSSSLDISDNIIKIGNTNPSGNGMNGNVFDAKGISPTLSTNKGEGIKVIGNLKGDKGHNVQNYYGIEGIAPTVMENHGNVTKVMIAHVSRSEEGKRLRKESMVNGKDFTPFQAKQISFKESDVMNCITTATTKDNLVKIGAIRGRGNNNTQQLEINGTGNSNSITTVQKDNVVVSDKIRRLTPRECFRLMDFPDTFTWPVSNSQAYKQAGNSIVVAVLAVVISKLNL